MAECNLLSAPTETGTLNQAAIYRGPVAAIEDAGVGAAITADQDHPHDARLMEWRANVMSVICRSRPFPYLRSLWETT